VSGTDASLSESAFGPGAQIDWPR